MAETAHELLERIRNENLFAFWKRAATLKLNPYQRAFGPSIYFGRSD